MQSGIKREEAGQLTKKLKECRVHLQKDNLYSCLTCFRDVLEKVGATRMLPADEKHLHHEINTFQTDLAASQAFRHLYGPVTFKDDDIETALDFMKQLIRLREDEMQEAMESQKLEAALDADQEDLQRRVHEIMMLVEKGEFSMARELAGKDEEAADVLIEIYNESGIRYRKAPDLEKAEMTFKKALFIRPEDEGLHYNLARAYIDAKDWSSAKNTMAESLKLNPDFHEGMKLMAFIGRNDSLQAA